MNIIVLSLFGPYVAAFAAAGIICMTKATGSLLVALRKTLAPLTVRELLFPPCALCWLTRGVVAASVLIYVT